jgi:hypothetical protein
MPLTVLNAEGVTKSPFSKSNSCAPARDTRGKEVGEGDEELGKHWLQQVVPRALVRKHASSGQISDCMLYLLFFLSTSVPDFSFPGGFICTF